MQLPPQDLGPVLYILSTSSSSLCKNTPALPHLTLPTSLAVPLRNTAQILDRRRPGLPGTAELLATKVSRCKNECFGEGASTCWLASLVGRLRGPGSRKAFGQMGEHWISKWHLNPRAAHSFYCKHGDVVTCVCEHVCV